MRDKYFTKFSNLTLKIGLEPEAFLRSRLALDQRAMKIYHELERLSVKYSLPMVSKRTVYWWIDKIKQDA